MITSEGVLNVCVDLDIFLRHHRNCCSWWIEPYGSYLMNYLKTNSLSKNYLTVSIACKQYVLCYCPTKPDNESTLTPDQVSCFIALDRCIIKNLNLEDKETHNGFPIWTNRFVFICFLLPGTFNSMLRLLPLYLYKLLIKGGCVSWTFSLSNYRSKCFCRWVAW